MDQRRIGDSSLLAPQELEWLEQNPQSVASATTSSIATRPVALAMPDVSCKITNKVYWTRSQTDVYMVFGSRQI
jgi:hypothetical protein